MSPCCCYEIEIQLFFFFFKWTAHGGAEMFVGATLSLSFHLGRVHLEQVVKCIAHSVFCGSLLHACKESLTAVELSTFHPFILVQPSCCDQLFLFAYQCGGHSLFLCVPLKGGWGCLMFCPVWNLRAVIWFPFPVSFPVFLPSSVALSVLSFFC